MNLKVRWLFFLFLFLIGIFFHYRNFFAQEQSLFLAIFDDPAPRWSFYPWLVESSRQFARGHFPLWCSLEGAGMPLLANYQSTPFNPFNLVFEIFPSLKLLDYLLLFKLFLLGIFTFLFSRELKLSTTSASLSAIIICFSGYISRTINQININTEILVPAGFLLVAKIFKNRVRFTNFLLLSLITLLALVGGNPEASFYYLVFLSAYSLVLGGMRNKRNLLFIGLSFCFAFFLSSAQLLSFVEYLGFGWHIHTKELHTIAKPSLRCFFSLFFPWLFGAHRSYPEQIFQLSYLGLVPVFLSLMSLNKIRSLNRQVLFFWVYALFFLGVIYRLPPFGWLNYLPIFNRVASTKFAYFDVCFCLAVLGGTGLEQFLRNRLSLKELGLSFLIISLLASGAIFLAIYFPLHSSASILRDAWLLPMILLFLSAGISFYGKLFEEIKLSSVLLTFLTLINLAHLSSGFQPEGKINPLSWKPQNPVSPDFLKPLLRARGRFVSQERLFPQNLNLIFGLNDFGVFEAIYPENYVRAIGEIEGFGMERSIEKFFSYGWSFDVSADNLTHPLVNQLGVKYFLSRHPLSLRGWTLISSSRDYYVYQNALAHSRAKIRAVSGFKFPLANAEIEVDRADYLRIRVKTSEPAELILAEQYAPGWRAFSHPGGEERKIFLEPPLFRKVLVKPDDGYLIFSYQPWAFRIGLFFSLISLGFGLGGACFWLAKKILSDISSPDSN